VPADLFALELRLHSWMPRIIVLAKFMIMDCKMGMRISLGTTHNIPKRASIAAPNMSLRPRLIGFWPGRSAARSAVEGEMYTLNSPDACLAALRLLTPLFISSPART